MELDKVFNANEDKTREGPEGLCMTIEGRGVDLQEQVPGNPV